MPVREACVPSDTGPHTDGAQAVRVLQCVDHGFRARLLCVDTEGSCDERLVHPARGQHTLHVTEATLTFLGIMLQHVAAHATMPCAPDSSAVSLRSNLLFLQQRAAMCCNCLCTCDWVQGAAQ